jgi:hypothetical protein
MEWTRKQALKALAGTGVGAAVALRPGVAAAAGAQGGGAGKVIERDVCVIGGGSSGTYTAVRLRDAGKSVVVVETKDRLGGHCETYHDPLTGQTTDIGVTVFHDTPLVRGYFGRFGVDLVTMGGFGGGSTVYADFRTGRVVDGYTPSVPTALGTYFGILQQYPYLATGFDLPDPVPAELLQPWGDFVTAYGLQSIAQLAYSFGQGFNDIMTLPALYVLKYFGTGVVTGILQGSFLTTARRDNSELYEKAGAFLGADVLLGSRVTAADRDCAGGGVLLKVDTPEGPRTIRAGKLLITVPPLPAKLTSFGLDARERAVFGRFRQGNYYTALMELSGVPGDLTVQNVATDTPYNLPPLPASYAFSPSSVPGLHDVKYGSAAPVADAAVRGHMLADLKRLRAQGTLDITGADFRTFSSHTPYELTVGAADIGRGFYRDLTALQGRRRTFWHGAAFHAHDSALLWEFSEQTLLPLLTA